MTVANRFLKSTSERWAVTLFYGPALTANRHEPRNDIGNEPGNDAGNELRNDQHKSAQRNRIARTDDASSEVDGSNRGGSRHAHF